MTGSERLITLDAVRGFAVIAILWVNILSFAMPDAAFLSPVYSAPPSPVDEPLWLLGFLLADGKFRGLFTLLFGASMALVMDRARAGGGSPRAVHGRRMAWLLVIGTGHYLLLWHGDVLLLYALMGLLMTGFYQRSPDQLMRWGLFGLMAGAIWLSWLSEARIGDGFGALGLGGHGAALQKAQSLHALDVANIVASVPADLDLFRSSYGAILAGRADRLIDSLFSLPIAAVETLPLMLMGMALYRSGFLSGEWSNAAYRRLAAWTLPLGLLLTGLTAAYVAASDYDPMVALASHLGLSVPGRVLMILGYAAALILLIRRFAGSVWTARFAATGRMALSNYLGTSLVMTSLFYGYGLGLFGTIDRIGLYGITAAGSLVMLIWSPWWMARYAYGPAEWLWRSLARGQMQPMRQHGFRRG